MSSIDALRQHLQQARQTIAVVVGAGLSAAVPDAEAMLEQFRREMRERGLGERFERELVAREAGADDYFAALEFIETQAGPWLVDRLVEEAVRCARRPDAPRSFEGDGDPGHWVLPSGLLVLARLLRKYPHVFRTPVLTTNFDPLLSLALQAAGETPHRSVVHFDGWHSDVSGLAHVTHLHGYWRGDEQGPHRSAHIIGSPKVEALIESKLRDCTVLMIGHRGRPGSLMRVLGRLTTEPNSKTKVLWCFHAHEDHVRTHDRELLAQLERWGALVFFGIDAHELFEGLAFEPSARESGAETIINEVSGIELVHIPAGSFLMGSAADDEQADDDERPQREVTLKQFYLARTPVTNAQYGRYLAKHPNAPKPEYWDRPEYNQPDQPVIGVSWDEAMAYCEWAGLVLPTEAQWEYACRAGKPTRYWSGDEESNLARVGWYDGNSERRLHAVGEKEANPFGLYDMHGNVWEWCRDGWGADYETEPRPGDGLRREPAAEGVRVVRGGSWYDDARDARSAYRFWNRPGFRINNLGFRPAQVIP